MKKRLTNVQKLAPAALPRKSISFVNAELQGRG